MDRVTVPARGEPWAGWEGRPDLVFTDLPADAVSDRLAWAIFSFLRFYPDLQTCPSLMAGLCQAWSELFAHVLAGLGFEGVELVAFELDDGRPMPGRYPLVPEDEGDFRSLSHVAVSVEGVVVDWTPRQYDDALPVPFVWSAGELARGAR